jgi:hypothetical protein
MKLFLAPRQKQNFNFLRRTMEKDGNRWQLPSEITLHILSFLGIKDLCVLDQVASFFHQLCELDELWLPFVSGPVAKLAISQYVTFALSPLCFCLFKLFLREVSCRLVMRCLHARWDGNNCAFGIREASPVGPAKPKKKRWALFSKKNKKAKEKVPEEKTPSTPPATSATKSGSCVKLVTSTHFPCFIVNLLTA